MKISVEAIKTLRDKTGAPMGSVRSALEEAKGDEAKAKEILTRKGFEAAAKLSGRTAGQGRIESYVHHNSRLGALVEINCETDFVARGEQFIKFCRDVAMHVASTNPTHVKADQLTKAELDEGKAGGKSPEQLAKERCLLEQPFIKSPGQTIGQYLSETIGAIRENIVIKRFVRFELGETANV